MTPNRLGRYSVVCAELCGIGHAYMRQTANVVSREDFDSWLEEKQNAGGTAGGGTAGGDTGTGASGSSGTTGDLNAPQGQRSTSDVEDPGSGNPAVMPGSPAGAGDAAGMMMGDFPPERVRRVQERLTAAGFDAGPADGVMGGRTRAALREFQRARGLDPTGEPNQATLTELGVE
jgi:peptidoglycan hydrolase-like protein with peptidoglycan-binding domain